MPTDSVSVFAEGTFEDQIQELVTYIVRPLSEEEHPAAIRPFQDALKTPEGEKPFAEDESRRKKVFGSVLKELKGLGEGSEKEIEGFFNLIFSHLFALYSSDASLLKTTLDDLLNTIASAPSSHTTVKYRILSNLFNALPRDSALRHSVYCAILGIAIPTESISLLQLSRLDVEKWLREWDITAEEKSAFLKTLAEAYQKSDPMTSYEYTLSYVRSLPSSSDAASAAAIDAISAALRLPTLFNFDSLFKLDAVIAVKEHELFGLLQLFLNDGLVEFKSWSATHSGTFQKYSLDAAQLENKIRLLTLASLGFKHVGQNVPYSTIAEAIQVDVADVEKWAIDVIRSGLLSGKLSQTTQTLHITRSTARSFERDEWAALEKRILAWKTGLAGVLEVVANARRQSGNPHNSLQAHATTVAA